MKKQDNIIVLLDVLQIIVSILTIISAIFILIYDTQDFARMAFIGVAIIAIILCFDGIANLKVDYRILKKYA